MSAKPFYQTITFQMTAAMALGAAVGVFFPAIGATLNPLAIIFIKLVKMVIPLIIFCTLTVGIAHIGSAREAGRIGLRSIVYFEIITSLALFFGMAMADIFHPGAGMNVNPATLDASAVSGYLETAKSHAADNFILDIIPKTAVDAFTQGNILQALLVSIFFGFALLRLGKHGKPIVDGIERFSSAVFEIVAIILKAAPLAVFGAMSYAVGKFGFGTLISLGKLVGLLYLSCFLFIVVIFGFVARLSGFSLRRFIGYIRDEALLAYAMATSEVALPRLIEKLEKAGCAPSVVGFVVPTGYSFNLDGSSIYLTLSSLFIVQATGVHLSLSQQVGLLGILLITSKGVANVPSASLVVLASTLSMIPQIPVAGIALLLGVDRIMDSMRTATNLIGNGVAAMAIAKWENERDDRQMHRALNDAMPIAKTSDKAPIRSSPHESDEPEPFPVDESFV